MFTSWSAFTKLFNGKRHWLHKLEYKIKQGNKILEEKKTESSNRRKKIKLGHVVGTGQGV